MNASDIGESIVKQPGWVQLLVQVIVLAITATWVVSQVTSATKVLGVRMDNLADAVSKLASKQDGNVAEISENRERIVILEQWRRSIDK